MPGRPTFPPARTWWRAAARVLTSRVTTAVLAGATGLAVAVGPAAAGAAGAGAAGAGAAGAVATAVATTVATPAAEDDPLTLTIDTLSPSVVPQRGRVTITGTVVNTSEQTWTDINVYPVLPNAELPMTTSAELEAAAASPAELVIGERYLPISDDVEELEPGGVAPYTLRIPRSQLPSSQGVHWLGVHALGGSDEGRDGFADGRARTFIPVVHGQKSVPTALVLQLRQRVQHASDGRVERLDQWTESLAATGRLGAVVELGAAAGDRPVTWLVDPAVVEAVTTIVAGNPGRLPERPPEEGGEGETPGPTDPTGSPAPTDGSTPTPAFEGEAVTAPDGQPADDPAALAEAAATGQQWLGRMQTAFEGKELLALPYGDVDASAASHLSPQTLVDAQTLSATAMAALGLPTAPVLGSPSGYLHPDAITAASPDTTLLVTSAAATGVTRSRGSEAVVDVEGHDVVLSSAAAVSGGPGPDARTSTVALRQRILAEAAVRLLGDRQPLVVTLPPDWQTPDAAGFFSGLDADFVDLRPLSEVADAAGGDVRRVAAEDLRYPVFQQRFELDAANFEESDDLRAAGATFQQVLTDGPDVEGAVDREAFAELSYWQRPRAAEARAATSRSRTWLRGTLGRITIDSPVSVTLSSATGQFPARVHNGLDEPVVVSVGAEATGGLRLDLPGEIALDPGESTRLRLSATTRQVGSHTVRLFLTTLDGTPTGGQTELPIRSNQVSEIIWIVIVAGGGLLFGAIAVRLVRRVRRSRRPPAASEPGRAQIEPPSEPG